MGKELVISTNRHETKAAILEDDQLVEIYFQRAREYSLAGSIHKGRVTRVLPGMQSAFVDIGLERDAFLYVSDFFEDNEEYDRIAVSGEERPQRIERAAAEPPPPPREAPPVVQAAPPPAERKEAPVPPPPRLEDADARDRRGRRSRRRRNRGRGFPESKYAYQDAPREAPPAWEHPAPESEEEFLVLPGESLAKHRAGAQEPAEEPEGAAEPGVGEDLPPAGEDQSEPEDAKEFSIAEFFGVDLNREEPSPVEDGAAAEAAEKDEPAAPPAAEEPAAAEAEAVSPEPDETSAAAVAERALAALEAAEEARATEGEAPAKPAGEGEPAEEPPAARMEERGEAPAEGDQEAAEAAAEGLEESSAPEEVVPGEGSEPPSEDVEPARTPTSLTAALRERGGRYLQHRVSRRLRRRMRVGGAPESGSQGELEGGDRIAEAVEAPAEPRVEAPRPGARPERPPLPSISELLREGQEILVQIAKEPLGQKGARITSHIALPGRFVVYMPTVEHMGVSRKIASDEERLRLKRILQTHRQGTTGGWIVRTAGEGRSEQEIASDIRFLYNLWLDIRQKAEKRPAPALIHHDLDLVERLLRDQFAESFKTVWIDNEEVYESTLRFVQRFQPGMVGRVKMYTRTAPIFDAFGITEELEKALRPKVWLKSGGYIVVNQTEALVAIDVNTGKFVGKSNRLEDTIVKTNTEAIKEIVRQIRLRDLGGIIVVDFIDMDERKNRQKVMQALEDAMRADRAPYKILQFNDFGLVAITRKRVKQSLERALCSPCPYCDGSGYVKSVQTIIGEILQEAHKIARAVEGPNVMLRANPEVAKTLKSNENNYLEELEEILGRPVLVKGDVNLHPEKFDLA